MHLGCRSPAVAPRCVCAAHRPRWASQLSLRTRRPRRPSDSPWCGITRQVSRTVVCRSSSSTEAALVRSGPWRLGLESLSAATARVTWRCGYDDYSGSSKAGDSTEGAPGCVRAVVTAVEPWLVAQRSGRRCQVACRCSGREPAGHDRPPTPTALDARREARDYH